MGASRRWRQLALLFKTEATYGLDAAPTGAVNAIQATEVTLTPLQGQDVNRDLYVPWLGHQGVILVNNYATLAFQVELTGSGAAGTAPAFGPLLRACAMAETVSAGTDVKYNPISSQQEAATILFNRDGVRHALLGSRGTFTCNLVPAQIPRLAFTFTGLLGPIGDAVLPATTLSAFKTPVPVSKANTVLTMFGNALAAESISFDLANQIEPRFLIGEETIEHVERQATGQVVAKAGLLAETNWFDRALTRARGAVKVEHGKTAGNIVTFDAPNVETGRPTEGESQRIMNYSVPLMLTAQAPGNNELVLTFK